jgi:hypothetical protein
VSAPRAACQNLSEEEEEEEEGEEEEEVAAAAAAAAVVVVAAVVGEDEEIKKGEGEEAEVDVEEMPMPKRSRELLLWLVCSVLPPQMSTRYGNSRRLSMVCRPCAHRGWLAAPSTAVAHVWQDCMSE